MGAATLRDDLKQRDIDAFELELIGLKYLGLSMSASSRAAMLRASIAAGWWASPVTSVRTVIEGKDERKEYLFDGVNVDDMRPNDAWHLGGMALELHNAATRFDPNWRWG